MKCLLAGILDDGPLAVPPHVAAGTGMLPRQFGEYELLEELARGGMGIVYKARQPQINRTVALKVMTAGQFAAPDFVARFRTEAGAAASLDHPNIVPVYEIGECEGQPFFCMKLIDGRTLAGLISERSGESDSRASAQLLATLARAVHYAHQRGILHRDIKPGNIMVDARGEPFLTDFGLAKLVGGDSTLTRTMAVLGTPSYMSPEQASGEAKQLTTAVDVYGLGAVFYEMLTGEPPFAGGTPMEIFRRVLEKEPRRPSTLRPGLNRDLETICLKCLQREPGRRYESAHALADDLERWLQHKPIAARAAGKLERASLWCRRNPRFAAMLGVVALALLLAVASLAAIAVVSARARQHAEKQELAARQRAYASDINLIQQALDLNNLGRAEELLNQHRPDPGQLDLRDWEWRYLWQQCRDEAQFTLCQRPSSIWALAASADGQWLAVGEEKRSGLSIWDWPARRLLFDLPPGEGEVLAAFPPRGRMLAASFESGWQSTPFKAGVRLWDLTTRQSVLELPLEGRCRGLAFSDDGGRLLVSSAAPGNKITIWELPGGKKLTEVAVPQSGGVGTPFAVTRDLKLAACRTAVEHEICLVDLDTGREVWRRKGAEEVVTALAFSPDGRILASGPGYTESAIRIWDVATGRELGRLEGHTSWVSQIVFFPDGRTMASASADQTIRLWEIQDRKPLGTLRGHRREIWRLTLMPDGVTLVSGSKDGSVRAWDSRRVRPERRRIVLPGLVTGWHLPANREAILTVDRKGRVTEWSGTHFAEQRTVLETGDEAAKACFSDDGARLAVQAPTGEIRLWDLRREVRMGEFTVPGSSAFPAGFREGGRKLVLFNWSGQDFHEWNIDTLKPDQSWQVVADRPNSSISLDEHWSLSIGQEANVVIRDLVAGRSVSSRLDIEAPGGIALSPDGQTIAAVSKQSYVRLWDRETGRELATLRGFLQGLHGAVFSANGRRLAIGSNGREAVKLWDLDSRQELLTLAGEGSIFTQLRFSPDGNVLTALNTHGYLHIWQAPSWAEIAAAEKLTP